MTVTFTEIEAAAATIHGHANRTPVLTSRTADEACNARIFFKCENFQRAGAFKFRGAYNAVSRLSAEQRRAGVLTWSSGNHAQAIALAGSLLGVRATIVMPTDAPAVKLRATRDYGAEIVSYDRAKVVRETLGASIASQHGLTIIPPYDHPDIVAGQGTAALELIADAGPLDAVVAPCGGGGLLSGTAVCTRHLLPTARVFGVEPAAADDAARSFRCGEIQTVQNPQTICDGARTPSLGALPFALIRRHVQDIHTVSDESVLAAMRFLWERLKIVVEPTGALAFAALLDGTIALKGASVGVIISGGNVDWPGT